MSQSHKGQVIMSPGADADPSLWLLDPQSLKTGSRATYSKHPSKAGGRGGGEERNTNGAAYHALLGSTNILWRPLLTMDGQQG